MKKLLFVFAATLTVVLVGCKKGAQDAEPEEIKLSVDPSSIISPSVGADYTLTLTAPEAWTASCADSWVKVNPTSGNAGTVEISVKIAADKTSTEASSKIVFKSGDQTVEVPVKRLAKDPARLMVVSETEIQTPKDGGVYSVKVESNIKWQISSNASWAKIDGEAVKRNNAIISVTVDPATTPEETVATLTVSPMEGSGVEKKTVTITRSASDATSMTIDKNQIDAPADGGSYSITVNTTAQWKATKSWDADWLTINNGTGDGSGSFSIKVDPATSANDASTVITVEEVRSDYYKPVQLNVLVTRKGKADAELSVDPTSITSPAEGGDFTVTIKSNYAWTASLVGTKIFSTSITKGDGDATMVVTVKPATDEKEATGSIYISSSYGGAKAVINIHREAITDRYYFSVSETQKVYFSKGNLQHHPLNNSWRFAEHQYDILGADNVNFFNYPHMEDYNGWFDLFAYATSGFKYSPTSIKYYSVENEEITADIAGTNNDWGEFLTLKNALPTDGTSCKKQGTGKWRTMTDEEWIYVMLYRKNTPFFATVNNVEGIFILPDYVQMPSDLNVTLKACYYSKNYTGIHIKGEFGDNIISLAEWTKLENAGAVFLPAAGRVYDTHTDDGGWKYNSGEFAYWTSSVRKKNNGEYEPYLFYLFDNNEIGSWQNVTYAPHAVRLVQDVE